jgi:putative hydrolase of the HAD superfamily
MGDGVGAAGAASAILLDALGTLVALEPPAPLLRVELARRFRVEVSEAEAQRAMAAEFAYYRAHLDEGSDPARLADLRARCAEVVRGALPPDCGVAGVEPGAMTDTLLASLRFTAFADVAPALEAARERGRRLVVVSNWDISLNGVLDRLGLAPLLDGIVTSAAAGARKPAAAIFERALEIAGARPSDAVHVGDSLVEDIAGARTAGIEPILIRRDGAGGPPGVGAIGSLAELA